MNSPSPETKDATSTEAITAPTIKQPQYPHLRYPYEKENPSAPSEEAITLKPEFPSPQTPSTYDESDKFTPEEHRSILNRYIKKSKHQP